MKTDQEKIDYCKRLYIEHGGKYHYLIEKSMREVGYGFSRRCLYRSGKRPGWIVKYGFRESLIGDEGRVTSDKSSDEWRVTSKERSVPPAVAGGYLFPCSSVSSVVKEKDLTTDNTEQTALRSCVVKENDPATHNTEHRELNSLSFEYWLKATSPMFNWDWPYQKLLYKKLRDVTAGKTKRLMIFLPPRHGKSELVTVRYAAWRLQQDPTLNIIVGSYNQKLANRFSRKIKNTLYDASHRSDKGRVMSDEGRSSSGCVDARVGSPHRSVPPAVAGGVFSTAGRDLTAKPQRRKEKTAQYSSSSPDACLPSAVSFSSEPSSLATHHSPRPINTAEEWETRQGGGVRAVGVGGGITGYGAGLIIIDDPIKSRSEAESKTIRDKVSDWFDDDLYTRLEPDAPIILIQTRWHEDDLAGRLLKEMEEEGREKWEVVSLPAIAEEPSAVSIQRSAGEEDVSVPPAVAGGCTLAALNQVANGSVPGAAGVPARASRSGVGDATGALVPCSSVPSVVKEKDVTTDSTEHTDDSSTDHLPLVTHHSSLDVLGRMPGEPLCPERFSIEALERIKNKLGTYSFSALYQQRPVPAEGAIFKRDWFRIIEKERLPSDLRWKRGYDLAISTRDSADFTATFKCAFDKDGNLYIGDGFRSRMNYPEQRRYILNKLLQERDVEHGIEDALHARAVLQDLRMSPSTRSVPFRTVRVTEDKITRALSWSTLAEEGKVFLVKAGWNRGLIEEAAAFPKGANDDQIDAISVTVSMLQKTRSYAVGF
jgi:predicted phage terminase large subunit-like protein